MAGLENFTIQKELYIGTRTQVFRATNTENGQSYILKTSSADGFSSNQVDFLLKEYKKAEKLTNKDVAKYLDYIQDKGITLVIEDIGAISLREYVEKYPFSMTDFLDIAISITQALAYIHSQSLVHKDINLSNIVINTDTKQVQIIDFGISSVLERSYQQAINLDLLEGTIAYISPEQTGRINRSIDYRSDLYSLGITFYELLSGKLPFEGKDNGELVYAHLAQIPTPLHTIASKRIQEQIPESLSEIVHKLIAKNAEDRYQTSLGLLYDLEKCKSLWQENKDIDFEIAQEDFSDKLVLPQKLYGREQEIAQIWTNFEKVCKGENQFLLVTGVSGIGKSSVIHSVYEPLTEKKGYFVSGKFDQLKKNIPYFAFIQAFSELFKQILTEDAAKIESWKNKLRSALGVNAALVTELIPEAEILLGKQKAVEELSAIESQNRLRYTLEEFVAVFTQIQHPLILFIDDLQWADSATLDLLEHLLHSDHIPALFLIGAYRHNEIDQNPHLQIVLNRIKEKRPVQDIRLAALKANDVQQFLQDTFDSTQDISELTELLVQKTAGNPFFLGEIVKNLYTEGSIFYQNRQWQWDIEKIKASKISDNVVDLLINKMKKLPDYLQVSLMYAACWGGEFVRENIYAICPLSKEQIDQAFHEAIAQDFLISWNTTESFVHDRVQQAAYALVEDSKKADIHAQIGRKLWNKTQKVEEIDTIFGLLNHLNQSLEVLTETEKKDLVLLNFVAGKRAKNANAYGSAIQYLSISKDLATDTIWQTDYDFAKNLWKDYAESHFLNNELSKSQEFIYEALEKCTSETDKMDFYLALVVQNTLISKYQEAIDILIQSLEAIGEPLPPKEDWGAAIGAGIGETFQLLGTKSIASLIDLSELNDTKDKSIIKMQAVGLVPSYIVDPNLFALLVVRATNFSIKNGNIPQSANVYSCFGILANVALGNLQMAHEFGELALKLAEKSNNTVEKTKASYIKALFTSPWTRPLNEMTSCFERAFLWGVESGELQYGGFGACYAPFYPILQDADLTTTFPAALQKSIDFNHKTNNQVAFLIDVGFKLNFFPLANLQVDGMDEEELIKNCLATQNFAALCIYHIYKASVALYLEDWQQALDTITESEKYSAFVAGMYFASEFQFYQSIILSQAYQLIESEDKTVWAEKIQANRTKFESYAQICPDNFSHKYQLIEAQWASIEGRDWDAIKHYKKAIEQAKEYRFLSIQALSNQLAANFWNAKDDDTYKLVHLKDAYQLYTIWGAKRISEHILAQNPEISLKKSFSTTQRSSFITTHANLSTQTHNSYMHTTQGGFMDSQTLIKASAAISNERHLDKLLLRMIQVIQENAGAEKVVILKQERGMPYIQATSNGDIYLKEWVKPEHKPDLLSVSIVNYVSRLQETVVLDDASQSKQFAKDEYIKKYSPKSILALPISYQGEVTAILYMENNLTYAAFQVEQLEAVKMLSIQMAISIENAVVYESLEERVKIRTSELQEAYYLIETKNKDITASINYASRIQNAILPHTEMFQKLLPNSFVFFKPKDVVSGDSYWLAEKENKTIIAAIDCTGHGVPGAFMSMIANDLLNQVVHDYEVHLPHDILNNLDALLLKTLKKDPNSEVRDGMDISVCTLIYEDGQITQINYAGAMNPFYYVQDGVFMEIKADKKPIGGQQYNDNSFTLHQISVNSPTTIYLSSDGFQDQFGGKENRKFLVKRFRELLFQIHQKDLSEQKQILEETLSQWKGNREQIDDILVIGFKINP